MRPHEHPPERRYNRVEPHEYERPPHEEIIELVERKFRELNERLDELEARPGR